jgi:hypothetical protein
MKVLFFLPLILIASSAIPIILPKECQGFWIQVPRTTEIHTKLQAKFWPNRRLCKPLPHAR